MVPRTAYQKSPLGNFASRICCWKWRFWQIQHQHLTCHHIVHSSRQLHYHKGGELVNKIPATTAHSSVLTQWRLHQAYEPSPSIVCVMRKPEETVHLNPISLACRLLYTISYTSIPRRSFDRQKTEGNSQLPKVTMVPTAYIQDSLMSKSFWLDQHHTEYQQTTGNCSALPHMYPFLAQSYP